MRRAGFGEGMRERGLVGGMFRGLGRRDPMLMVRMPVVGGGFRGPGISFVMWGELDGRLGLGIGRVDMLTDWDFVGIQRLMAGDVHLIDNLD
jgi:hypothetical protein